MKKLLSIILACLSLTLTAETRHTEYYEVGPYNYTCTYCNTNYSVKEIWKRVFHLDNFGNVIWASKLYILHYVTECPYCGRKPDVKKCIQANDE